MEHTLPALPYPKEALQPHISKETFEYHYGKHHQAYVNKLNTLIKGTKFENMQLDEIIKNSEGPIFNNAAQHWNHSFFWNCMGPKAGGYPGGRIGEMITKKWENFDKFKETFSKSAVDNFGSGWTWLVQNSKGDLEIMNTSNADTPMAHGMTALLTLDVWEHAYYIDYRNARPDFVTAFWNVVNWEFANKNLR
ncbi:superoxide dismutase [Peredibacter starrii]|uniref:Superoxide dismutase n=1 Tax=Peredibacter starrii TaxID=28202 RepID=A0AAX4HM76_9BACT|nr:superoxide dismutase [Peredibacter starrii]WPU64262.1 superoxide dismutase [Peredibacter starrii]